MGAKDAKAREFFSNDEAKIEEVIKVRITLCKVVNPNAKYVIVVRQSSALGWDFC